MMFVDQPPHGSGERLRSRQIRDETPSRPLRPEVIAPDLLTDEVLDVLLLHRPRTSSVAKLNTTFPDWYTGLPWVDRSDPLTLAPFVSHEVTLNVPDPSSDETFTAYALAGSPAAMTTASDAVTVRNFTLSLHLSSDADGE